LGKLFYLPVILELIYFALSFVATPPLLKALLVFPCLFVLPGIALLTVTKRRLNDELPELIVEGFFVSTLILTTLTSFMFMSNLPLNLFWYSLVSLVLVLLFTVREPVRRTMSNPSKSDVLLLTLTLSSYVALLLYFSGFPRLFHPNMDETSYIFSARMGVLNGEAPPVGVTPNRSEFCALMNGRLFWTYLLASFLACTGLPTYQAGLLGTMFLAMTSLTTSLLVRDKWLRVATSALALINPLLLGFSDLALNDLTIAFYGVFSTLSFVKSLSKIGCRVSIDFGELVYSFLGLAVLSLVKTNLLILIPMWLILMYLIVRHKLCSSNETYKILAIVLLPLAYELSVDVPYVISMRIMRDSRLAGLFGNFLFASPAQYLIFSASTYFAKSFGDRVDYFYTLLSPEFSNIIITAVVTALPLIMLQKDVHRDFQTKILALLVFMSVFTFHFQSLPAFLRDISRYSLWMVPLWMPLAMMILKEIKESSRFSRLLPILCGALILLWINTWLSREKDGVFIGYNFPYRSWTVDVIMIELISLTITLCLLISRKYLWVRFAIKDDIVASRKIDVKKMAFCLSTVIMLINGVYFNWQFAENSRLHEDLGLSTISDSLSENKDEGSLVLSNNYIHMRTYINDDILKEGLLIPLPDTEEELLKLVEIAPNNTRFLISTDPDTTSYEYANLYIKKYANSSIIKPEKPSVSKLPKLNVTEPFLEITFDDANETTVIDHGGFRNYGTNYGAKVIEGYYGKAVRFDGKEYISIRINEAVYTQNAITISFFAKIEEARPTRSYTILSKGYPPLGGSFAIFVWNSKIYFELGAMQSLSFPLEPYNGTWHYFIFTYGNKRMEAFVDGKLVDSKPAEGAIKVSTYDLEIGRDSQRKISYFVGEIDELQISYKPLDEQQLGPLFGQYAFLVSKLSLPKGQASLFSVVGRKSGGGKQEVFVKSSRIGLDEDLTATLEMEIGSTKAQNISILAATTYFTKVYTTLLNSGCNHLKYRFDYNGSYWRHSAQMRLIVIDENGNIVHNDFISRQNLDLINNFLLVLLGGFLFACLAVSHK